jgi:hypothetical protein
MKWGFSQLVAALSVLVRQSRLSPPEGNMPMELTPEQRAFHLAEFSALKSEVREAVTSAGAHFRWAAVTSAAVVAWLSTEGQDLDIPLAAFFAPAAITLLLGGLSAVLHARIGQIGRYLLKLETVLGRKPELGWEEAFAQRKRMLGALYAAGWIVLLGADVYAGVTLQSEALGDQQFETRQASNALMDGVRRGAGAGTDAVFLELMRHG